MAGRLEGQVILVTGGGSGIGRASALAMAAEGALVFPADIDPDAAAQTAEMVVRAGGRASAIDLDVTDESGWIAAIDLVRNEAGRLTALVNNAGTAIIKPLLEMSLEAWRRQLSLNLDSVFLGTRAALPLLSESPGSTIINVASSAGRQGVPMMSGYCASKAGVINFTRAMALECAQLGIPVRINVISPGSVATPLWYKLANDGEMPDEGPSPQVMDHMRLLSAQVNPIGFAGEAEDIASAIVFMASQEARFMFGGELVLDGGNSAGNITKIPDII